MSPKQNRRPGWKVLYQILLLAIGSLALEHMLHLTPIEHKLTLLLIVVVIYGAIGLWLKSNAADLERPESRTPAPYKTPASTPTSLREGVSFYQRET